MTTLSVATTKMIGLLTQLQKYPDIEGVQTISSLLATIAKQYNQPIPPSIEKFVTALTFDRHDELDKALTFYEECIALCDDSEMVLSLLAKIFIGSICADQDDYLRSYQMFDVVLSHAHLLDGYPLSLTYTNLSGLYCNMKRSI